MVSEKARKSQGILLSIICDNPDLPFRFDTVNLGWPMVYIEGVTV